jgi:ppGpp synthetase/RelA/SpoT-type nucleotidyltranferase
MGEAQSKENILDELLIDLKGVYDDEFSEYQKCLDAVADDLGHVLGQEAIRHLPVAHRVKSWKSIEGTAQRRQQDRLAAQTIQQKMIELKENWEQHFDKYKMSKTKLGYFKHRDELQREFHDMLGARIVLYFPSDTKKVLKLVEAAGYKSVKDPKRMGGLADVRRLRKLAAKWLDESTSKAPADDLDLEGLEQQFSGYGAIHLAVKVPERLRPRDLSPEAAAVWDRTIVEFQIGTVIMHAWAEVEHDITYKSHGREVPQDEKAVLDILNGLALASEVGLRRFRSSPQSPSPPAESAEELHTWLHQLYIDKDRSTPAEWADLDKLWDYLVQRHQNRRDTFRHLAEAGWVHLMAHERKEGVELDHVLPFIIMHHHPPPKAVEEGRRLKAMKELDQMRTASRPPDVEAKNKSQLVVANISSLIQRVSDRDLAKIERLVKRCKLKPDEEGDSSGQGVSSSLSRIRGCTYSIHVM